MNEVFLPPGAGIALCRGRVSFLFYVATIYVGLNGSEPASQTRIFQLTRVSEFTQWNTPTLLGSPRESSASNALNLHRSLSLFLHDAFSGGAGIAGSFSPARWMQLQVALIENSVRPGVEAGVAWIPFDLWVAPTLSVEAGHYFPADAASMLRALTANSKIDCSLLENFSRDYESGYLGFELVSGPLSLSVKGGLMHAEASTLNVTRVLEASALNPAIPSRLTKNVVNGPCTKLALTLRL